ncbi:MAG: DNA repair protein RecN [Crocinitomicaceae bacterium]
MLSKIWIKNFALIQELNFDFQKGYTVITGETGSGKSILLGAINLILGERADFSLIGPDSDKTIVEAEFSIGNLGLQPWFINNDIDFEPNTLVRREINRQGRSRAFVNDTPVSLQQIKQLTEGLINIHSQHHTIALRDKNFHLELLDVLAGIEKEVLDFSVDFQKLKQKQKVLREEKEHVSKAEADKDYLTFQLEELASLHLGNTNYQKIEEELEQQENMESIVSSLDAIRGTLDDENGSIAVLKILKSKLERSAIADTKLSELVQSLNSAILELDDISSESSNYLEHLEKNPERILELTSKLDAYNRVIQKHKCTNQAELMELETTWHAQVDFSIEGQAHIDQMELEILKETNQLNGKANQLHDKRTKAAVKIQQDIATLLAELKMPNTQLEFDLKPIEEFTITGKTAVSMLFSTNKGMSVQPIEKIASGGELSRLMLAIQCLISEVKQLPSIVFDEIDTGVSGEVAQKIGSLLQRMGNNLQLIAISHLPQVAGKAMTHILVEKQEKEGRILSSLRQLTQEERIQEIARLMSGEAINEAALANAKSLMDQQ